MRTGWAYRVVSLVGTAGLTACAVLFANFPVVQELFTTYIPIFNRLRPTTLTGSDLGLAVGLSVLAITGSVVPLFKPRPRRILDTVALVQKRVVVGGLALATLGYFQWSHRLPRATLTMTIGALLVVLPAWFVWIRRTPGAADQRAIVVGDDLGRIRQVVKETELHLVGYLCPTAVLGRRAGSDSAEATIAAPDGGTRVDGVEHLGGLSRIEDILVDYDIDTVILAFKRADRGEFFGALDACYEHGVTAKIHRDHADTVLTAEGGIGTFVDIEIEPWDVQDYIIKRGFDVAFAITGLTVFAPLAVAIAVAIKLDSSGPVLYEQERTAIFGETFSVYKFRSMMPGGEVVDPIGKGDENRVTRTGRFLRRTHLDEIPQLWSILVGDMSVVGPRAVWTEEEDLIETVDSQWRKRWFVKPGLTGLAQINDATSQDPREKIQYDLRYIRKQSFVFDLRIVIRQCWKVCVDLLSREQT
jgi:lipopolysaccharide/colanic/teichoic acid biosynthesis glycosyltransferase